MATLMDKLMIDPDLENTAPRCTAQENHDLERSIVQAGCIYPLVIDQDFNIIDGFRRYRVLRRHKMRDFRCVVLRCESAEDRRRYRTTLNDFRR
jgi:ParB-like chromosome segregation protein Spo0J